MNRRVKRLRHVERVRMLLEAGDQIAAECPYWTEGDSSFAGIESDEGRVVILAESVGAGALRLAGVIDLVTEFDLAAEAHIRTAIEARYPAHRVVGEEGGESGGGKSESDAIWYVDPIDGTTNFAHGHLFFCCSIAFYDAGEAIAGAVVAPALGVSWSAGKGLGATRNGEPCKVSETDELANALCATGFPYDRWTNEDNNEREFGQEAEALRSAATSISILPEVTQQQPQPSPSHVLPPQPATDPHLQAAPAQPVLAATQLQPTRVSASSEWSRPTSENHYPAGSAFDGRLSSAWNEGVSGPGTGEWLQADFNAPMRFRRVDLATGWDVEKRGEDLFPLNSHAREVVIRVDGVEVARRAVAAHQRFISINLDAQGGSVQIVFVEVYAGTRFDDLAIPHVEIWGN